MANPAKRPRNTVNLQVTQHIRTFNLPQQFPSNVKVLNPMQNEGAATSIIGKNTLNLRPMGPYPSNIKLVPNKPMNITNKLQKLKLQTRDGRDLGEFNVKYLPQNLDSIGGKKITLTKHSSLKKLEKPLAVSLLKPKTNGEETKLDLLPVQVPVVEGNFSFLGHNYSRADSTDCNLSDRSSASRSDTGTSHNEAAQEKNPRKRFQSMPDGHKVVIVRQEKRSSATNIERSFAQKPQSQKLVILETDNSSQFPKSSKVPAVNSTSVSKSDKYSAVEKSQTCWSAEELSAMVVKSSKEGKDMRPFGTLKTARIDNVQRAENSKPTVYITVKGSNKKDELNNPVCNRRSSVTENKIPDKQQNDGSFGDDVMVVLRNDSVVSQCDQKKNPRNTKLGNNNSCNDTNARKNPVLVSRNTNKKQVDTREEGSANSSGDNTLNKADDFAAAQSCEMKTNKIGIDCKKTNPKDLTNDINIIQEALSSVKDADLRDKALKALAGCGISIERLVPLRPPPDMQSVRDSEIQTDFFGLIDNDNFIRVKENNEIEKKKPIEMLIDLSCAQTSNPSTHLSLSQEHSPMSPSMSDIESLLHEFLPSNTGHQTLEVENALSRTNSLAEKTLLQLQIDFDTARVHDDQGMLSIHRAVLNGRIREVQRQIIVLEALKENVDLPTSDDETSLELAVRHDVDPEIVKILLQAGAQPASSKSIHESAIIIASRMSSPLLPDLIRHVRPSSLLDAIDSDGFASAHYCAQLGNAVGIRALIEGNADVNLPDNRSGRTPLFHALESRHVDIAFLLLNNGAASNIPNFGGQTALSLLEDLKNLSLAESMHRAMR